MPYRLVDVDPHGNRKEKYHYYVYNGYGDVVQMVSEDATIVNEYEYDEWVNILKQKETVQNDIKYSGEYYDSKSGLYYLRARYYDPTIRRFISGDSYEGSVTNPLSLNLYTYCHNNPVNYSDPSGHIPTEEQIRAGMTEEELRIMDEKIEANLDAFHEGPWDDAVVFAIGFTPVDIIKDGATGKDTITQEPINRWIALGCVVGPEV